MNPRMLAAFLLLAVLALAEACGTGAARCTVAADCAGQGACQGGFCTDLGLLGGGHPDAAPPDSDQDGGTADAGQDADAGQVDNGRG